MLNKQGEGTKIDWAHWSYNPVGGCLHGCTYCYLIEMGQRFDTDLLKVRFKPEWLEKFSRVRKIKPDDRIFMGSSGDMWGNWVAKDWIEQCLRLVEIQQEYKFLFLTKNPARYGEFLIQPNAWYGTTIDGSEFSIANLNFLMRGTTGGKVRFVSFEPLLNKISDRVLANIMFLDWIIIGPDSNKGAKKPKAEWVEEIIHAARAYSVPIWLKDNLDWPETIKELPGEGFKP